MKINTIVLKLFSMILVLLSEPTQGVGELYTIPVVQTYIEGYIDPDPSYTLTVDEWSVPYKDYYLSKITLHYLDLAGEETISGIKVEFLPRDTMIAQGFTDVIEHTYG